MNMILWHYYLIYYIRVSWSKTLELPCNNTGQVSTWVLSRRAARRRRRFLGQEARGTRHAACGRRPRLLLRWKAVKVMFFLVLLVHPLIVYG